MEVQPNLNQMSDFWMAKRKRCVVKRKRKEEGKRIKKEDKEEKLGIKSQKRKEKKSIRIFFFCAVVIFWTDQNVLHVFREKQIISTFVSIHICFDESISLLSMAKYHPTPFFATLPKSCGSPKDICFSKSFVNHNSKMWRASMYILSCCVRFYQASHKFIDIDKILLCVMYDRVSSLLSLICKPVKLYSQWNTRALDLLFNTVYMVLFLETAGAVIQIEDVWQGPWRDFNHR